MRMKKRNILALALAAMLALTGCSLARPEEEKAERGSGSSVFIWSMRRMGTETPSEATQI